MLDKVELCQYNYDITLDWKANSNVSKTLRNSGTPCSKEHLDDLNIVDINELCVYYVEYDFRMFLLPATSTRVQK